MEYPRTGCGLDYHNSPLIGEIPTGDYSHFHRSIDQLRSLNERGFRSNNTNGCNIMMDGNGPVGGGTLNGIISENGVITINGGLNGNMNHGTTTGVILNIQASSYPIQTAGTATLANCSTTGAGGTITVNDYNKIYANNNPDIESGRIIYLDNNNKNLNNCNIVVNSSDLGIGVGVGVINGHLISSTTNNSNNNNNNNNLILNKNYNNIEIKKNDVTILSSTEQQQQQQQHQQQQLQQQQPSQPQITSTCILSTQSQTATTNASSASSVLSSSASHISSSSSSASSSSSSLSLSASPTGHSHSIATSVGQTKESKVLYHRTCLSLYVRQREREQMDERI